METRYGAKKKKKMPVPFKNLDLLGSDKSIQFGISILNRNVFSRTSSEIVWPAR